MLYISLYPCVYVVDEVYIDYGLYGYGRWPFGWNYVVFIESFAGYIYIYSNCFYHEKSKVDAANFFKNPDIHIFKSRKPNIMH